MTKPNTHDVTVHTTKGSVVYRYVVDGDGWRMIGVVNPDGTLGPVPAPAPPPPPTHLPDGRMINPPPPLDLSGLPVGDPPEKSITEQVWDKIKDLPPST